MVFGIGIEWIN